MFFTVDSTISTNCFVCGPCETTSEPLGAWSWATGPYPELCGVPCAAPLHSRRPKTQVWDCCCGYWCCCRHQQGFLVQSSGSIIGAHHHHPTGWFWQKSPVSTPDRLLAASACPSDCQSIRRQVSEILSWDSSLWVSKSDHLTCWSHFWIKNPYTQFLPH